MTTDSHINGTEAEGDDGLACPHLFFLLLHPTPYTMGCLPPTFWDPLNPTETLLQ